MKTCELCNRTFGVGNFRIVGDDSTVACLDCAQPTGAVQCKHYGDDGSWLRYTVTRTVTFHSVEVDGGTLLADDADSGVEDDGFQQLVCVRCAHRLPVPATVTIRPVGR